MEADLFHLALSILRKEQDCSDAVQEAVVKAYANRHTLRNPVYFKTWIMRRISKKYWFCEYLEGQNPCRRQQAGMMHAVCGRFITVL